MRQMYNHNLNRGTIGAVSIFKKSPHSVTTVTVLKISNKWSDKMPYVNSVDPDQTAV